MIYLGFLFEPISHWEAIMPIKAPSNYKKREAIDSYIASRREALANGEAAESLLVGTVKEITVDGDEDGNIATHKGDEVYDVFKTIVAEVEAGRTVAGYRIHRAMKLLATMASIRGRKSGDTIPLTVFKLIYDFYNRVPGFVDPVSLLFGASDVDLSAAALRIGVSVDPSSSRALADFAKEAMRGIY